MAAGLLDRYAVAADLNFQKRVAQALVETAVTVYSGESVKTSARAVYAVQVATDAPVAMLTVNATGTTDPDKRVYAVARLITTQGIDGASTDAQITAAVATVWNALAGA